MAGQRKMFRLPRRVRSLGDFGYVCLGDFGSRYRVGINAHHAPKFNRTIKKRTLAGENAGKG